MTGGVPLETREVPPAWREAASADKPAFEQLFGHSARRARVTLTPIGVGRVPEAAVSLERFGETWWLSAEAACDPCRVNGWHAVPEFALARLKMLSASGLRLDYLRVLHEIRNPLWSPDQPVPQLVPAAPLYRAIDAALLRASQRLVSAVAGVVDRRRSEAIAGAADTTVGDWGGDPVLVGGRRVAAGRVFWVEIARWDW